jgi:hypothetical protein
VSTERAAGSHGAVCLTWGVVLWPAGRRKGLWSCAASRGAGVAVLSKGKCPLCGVGHVGKARCSP